MTTESPAPVSKNEPTVDPRARNLVWRSCQIVLQALFVIWLRFRTEGRERLPPGGALLLVNHQSMLDPLLTGAALQRPISFLARHNLFSIPVIGWILRNTYVMPIRREAAGTESIRLCVQRLQQGYYVGMFPEGTRTHDGSLGEIKPGFLAIARRANVPIVPVGLAGALQALPRGAWWLRPATVRVVYGQPISAEEVRELTQKGREQEFLERIRVDITRCMTRAEAWRSGKSLIESPHSK